ncbi:MAG: hypothetical protein FD127_4279 [Acidimicrobiaceae bacterium]|nr:MAG: hypothetical protein FD127_4279 [Acidimicrobiaceae bacterium]
MAVPVLEAWTVSRTVLPLSTLAGTTVGDASMRFDRLWHVHEVVRAELVLETVAPVFPSKATILASRVVRPSGASEAASTVKANVVT